MRRRFLGYIVVRDRIVAGGCLDYTVYRDPDKAKAVAFRIPFSYEQNRWRRDQKVVRAHWRKFAKSLDLTLRKVYAE